jgi:very-short-patch-repair endonuclease
MPIFFIELDSSWHDEPKQVEKDRMKDEIFEKAGMALHRLRKKENKNMEEIFELYIKANYLQ